MLLVLLVRPLRGLLALLWCLLLSCLLALLLQSCFCFFPPDFLREDLEAELLLIERRAVAGFDALDEGLVLSLPLVSQPSFLLKDGFLILVLLLVMGADLAEVGCWRGVARSANRANW